MKKLGQRHINRIIRSCIKKNANAQRKLYDLLYDKVIMNLQNFGFGKETIEDLAQETFIQIFLNLETFDNKKSSIFTWSSVIAKRLGINHYRKNISSSERMSEFLEESFLASSQKEVDFLAMELVFEAIESLPEQYREVFELYVFQAKSHKEITSILTITESSSRVYLTRAKKQIRKILENHGVDQHNIVEKGNIPVFGKGIKKI